MTEEIQEPDVERIPLAVYTERAYLDYSLYVINDRALPHLADGRLQAVLHLGAERACALRVDGAHRRGRCGPHPQTGERGGAGAQEGRNLRTE